MPVSVLRYVVIGIGAVTAIATAVQDALSAHPDATWKALIFAAGVGLAAYGKKFFMDFSPDELPFGLGTTGEPDLPLVASVPSPMESPTATEPKEAE